VSEDTIDEWAKGLPKTRVLHIVSLLGKKKGGFSEFDYYPFRSATIEGSKPTFEEWLNARYGGGRFVVDEFPTVDADGIPSDVVDRVKECVLSLLEAHIVLVIDSAGAKRTARICEACHFRK
jgi:hypothetical protein